MILAVGFAIRGIDGVTEVLFLAGLVVFTFATTYPIALFFLRMFGGEMDPPTSPGYRRRP